MKVLGIIFLVIVGAVMLANMGGSNDSKAAAPDTPPVKLVAAKSFCIADAANAKLHFYMTLRNPHSAAQDVDARPWRRYSDASTNDSIMDMLTMTVPAGKTKKFKAELGYNAEKHTVLECGLYFDGKPTVTKIAAL